MRCIRGVNLCPQFAVQSYNHMQKTAKKGISAAVKVFLTDVRHAFIIIFLLNYSQES